MRVSQAGCGPQGRSGPAAGRVSNSAANPLRTAFYSAAGRVGQIVSKTLIDMIFSVLTGGSSGAEKRLFPALREMPADPAACRPATDFAVPRLPPAARPITA